MDKAAELKTRVQQVTGEQWVSMSFFYQLFVCTYISHYNMESWILKKNEDVNKESEGKEEEEEEVLEDY